MAAANTGGAHRSGSASRRSVLPLLALAGSLAVGYMVFGLSGRAAAPQAAPKAAALSGTASLSGTVDSAKPFKAAQVYLRNVDKRIRYMVYTNAGQFRAVALFPGNYEINATAKGLKSDVQKLVVKAGDNPKIKVTLQEAAARNAGEGVNTLAGVEDGDQRANVTFAGYDEIYQPGVGRDIIERTCIICHGENFLPSRPTTAAVWNTRIDHMQGRELFDRPAATYAEGLLSFRAQWLRFSRQDREDLVAYLVKNFGPGAKPRMVRTDKEVPLDEAKLGKASTSSTTSPRISPARACTIRSTPMRPARTASAGDRTCGSTRTATSGQSDRGVPRRLIKLDPRTGEMKEWVTPHPKSDVHEVMIGRDGMIWMPEHAEGWDAELPARLQPEDREVGLQHRHGSGRRRPESHQVDAVDRHRLEEQHVRRLDHGRRAEQGRRRDEERSPACSRFPAPTPSSTAR